MASSEDTAAAKKMYASVRPFVRELLEHLCIEANSEKDSIFLSLDKVMKQFWPILRAVCERQETRPHVPNRDVTDLEARLGSKPFRQLYHDALDVAFDVKFGHMQEFTKGTPGPKQNLERAARIKELVADGKNSEQIRQMLETEGVNLSLSGVQSYRKSRYGSTRRKKPQQ